MLGAERLELPCKHIPERYEHLVLWLVFQPRERRAGQGAEGARPGDQARSKRRRASWR